MSKLTGKCKEDFEFWLLTYRNEEIVDREIKYDLYYIFKYMMPETIQNELIIEFFDSVGIYILTDNLTNCVDTTKFGFPYMWQSFIKQKYKNKKRVDNCLDSRQEATNKAIEKANELYNEK